MLISSTAGSVTTPNPLFGDSDNVDIRGVVRRAMDGTIYGYKTTPTTSNYTVEIDGMTRAIAEALAIFIDATLSEANPVITMNYNGKIRVGELDMQSVTFTGSKIGYKTTLTIHGDN